MIKHRIGLSATVLVCLLGLSACGGGGGSAGTPSNPAPTESPMLGISASNYQVVGQSAVSSAFFLNDTGGVITGAETGSDPRLLRHAVDTARRAMSVASGRQALLTGAEVRETVPCSQGGSLAVTVTDVNNNGNFDLGDSLSLDAQSCKEDGDVMNGRISLSVQALTGVYDSSNYSATLAMTLTAFNVTTGSDMAQGDGTITLTVSQTPAGVGEVVLATSRLVLSGRAGGQNFTTTLTDTKLTLRIETVNGSPRTSISYNSSLAGSGFDNKQVLITTPQPLVITGSDTYPSSGYLLVQGNASSALRITAVNRTQARLELDAQGDGAYETQVLKTWAELE
ncbi:hypothetical protein J2X20_000227 [Pelomonas saccharophila]|uniref:Uncharacterized protein n=1 Tax=Roseateles saccharophilus TaxID=304 RepID=A0ABU1YFS6_ROSSA|nr:hypothetical protein [Roseateles saccharophilus]MDR7267598.1 hypothetical protein [Roseateles saccharophilus]